MDIEIASGVNKVALNDFAKRDIVQRGEKRGSYALEPSVAGYCAHLREIAAGRTGVMPVRTRALVSAPRKPISRRQEPSGLEARSRRSPRSKRYGARSSWAFRARLLAMPARMHYLDARQNVTLTRELRACLDELADDKAA
jgi:hypothetical protein